MRPFTSSEADHAKIDRMPHKCRGCKEFIAPTILAELDAATRRAQVELHPRLHRHDPRVDVSEPCD